MKQHFRTYFLYKTGVLKIVDFIRHTEYKIQCICNKHKYFEIPNGVIVPAYILGYAITLGAVSNLGIYVNRLVYALNTGIDIHGKHIHHLDKNPKNNFIGNLICVSITDHNKIHGKWSINND